MSESDDTSTPESRDEKTPETFDGATGLPVDTPAKKERIKLSDLRDVRLEMARVYRMVDDGELKSQEGTRRVYILRQIGDIISMHELERRIQELEDRQAQTQSGRLLEHQADRATAH